MQSQIHHVFISSFISVHDVINDKNHIKMSDTRLLCRFCSQRRSNRTIIDLEKRGPKERAIINKINIFSEMLVDLEDISLPLTICTVCRSMLDKSHEFFNKVKKSQVTLRRYFKKVQVKEEPQPEQRKTEVDILEGTCDLEAIPSKLAWLSYPWICSQCDATFSSGQELISHSQDEHHMCCTFKCEDCGEQPVSFEEFIEHVRGHRPNLINYCPHCNIKMESLDHIRIHTTDFNCTFCGQSFDNDIQLYTHLKKYITKMGNDKQLVSMLENVDSIENDNDKADNITNLNSFMEKDTLDFENDMQCDTESLVDQTGTQINPFLPDLPFEAKSEDPNVAFKIEKPYSQKKKVTKRKTNAHKDNRVEGNNETDRTQRVNTSQTTAKTKPEDANDSSSSENADDDDWTEEKEIKRAAPRFRKPKSIKLWSQYPLLCRYCHNLFKTRETLKKHSLTTHSKCFAMKCIDCREDTLKNIYQFISHVTSHRPELKLLCYFCEESLTDPSHLPTHDGQFHCNLCGNNFTSKSGLIYHQRNNDTPDQMYPFKPKRRKLKSIKLNNRRFYLCKICQKYVSNLANHADVHNKRQREFICEKCGKCFHSQKNLNNHIDTHDESLKVKCNICGAILKNRNMLKKHIVSHNLLLKRFQCDHCKKTFSLKDNLRAHMIVHSDRKDFQCEYCSKRFKTRKLMLTHTRTHTGLKPLVCDLCGEAFMFYAGLSSHRTKVHGLATGANTVMTQYGRLKVDPATGDRLQTITLTEEVLEWTKNVMAPRNKKST